MQISNSILGLGLVNIPGVEYKCYISTCLHIHYARQNRSISLQ